MRLKSLHKCTERKRKERNKKQKMQKTQYVSTFFSGTAEAILDLKSSIDI
jgi:hypothetical protein